MSNGAQDGSGPTLEEGVRAARSAIEDPAPLLGIIDLPAFDEMVAGRSMESRRNTVYAQLGTAIPLLRSTDEIDREARADTQKKTAWISSAALFVLMVIGFATGLEAAAGALTMLWLGSLLLAWAVSRSGRPGSSEPITDVAPRGVKELELRVVWVARRQTAAILGSRAWNSEDLRGNVAVIDLAELLARITGRATDLYRFIASASPEPTGAQPELVAQWRKERDRVVRAREALIEQLAGLIIYRRELDRVSALLDQRDQMGVLAERASVFDQIGSDHAGPSPSLDAAGRRSELEHNLTAQIRFLGEMADRSPSAGPLSGAINRE